MTREEAAVYIAETFEWVMREYENHRADRTMMQKTTEAFDVAIAALRDPDTGLVPCGCGGVARVAVQYAYPDERRVFCERCGLTTIWLCAPMSVLQFHWNRAMGTPGVDDD